MDTTKRRIEYFKTAYSPLYEQYVEILGVHHDDSGDPILTCRIAFTDKVALFREFELEQYCL